MKSLSIFENKKVKKQITQVAELAQYLWQYGWAERNAGNISVNMKSYITEEIPDIEKFPYYTLNRTYPELAGGYFFVTGTGKRMRDLARNPIRNACLIRITDDANQYQLITAKKSNLYNFRPTSELPSHLAVHQKIAMRGTGEKAVVHTHPNELVALTQIKEFQTEQALNKMLWGMHPESVVFVPKGLGLVPYILPGSQHIAEETLKKFDSHDVVMWEKHGTFAIGQDVFDAFDMIDILAKSARIYFMVKHAGFEPEGLSEKQINELKKAFL